MLLRTLLAGSAALMVLVGVAGSAKAQDDLRDRMFRNHVDCDRGDRAACVRFGILIGENRQRHADWRREHPEWWWWERR